MVYFLDLVSQNLMDQSSQKFQDGRPVEVLVNLVYPFAIPHGNQLN